MADIVCPNCGKVNPSFADVCLNCGTALTPPPPATGPLQENSEEDIPEWLKRIRERTQQESAVSPLAEEPVAPFNPGDLPDWLKELKEEKIAKDSPPAPEPEAESGVDWLERLRTSPVYDQNSSGKTGPLSEPPAGNGPSNHQLWGPENGPEVPDWLKAATNSDRNALSDFVFPKSEDTHPDDITSPVQVEPGPNPFAAEPTPTSMQREADASEFLSSPAADWGENSAPYEETRQEELPFPAGGPPVTSGPAGPEPAYGPDFFQTTALSNRIQLSEKQRLNVSLLKNIIAMEGEPRPVSSNAAKRPGRTGLLVVFFSVILILLAVLIITPIPSALPQLYPLEIASLFNQVSTLPQNAPVLVAVDYDPSLAGEMQMSASALLGHLMSRNARLTFISTRPSGPMLADALLRAVLPGQPQYPFADHSLNLGYLPGDAAGLRTFAGQPRDRMPYALDLQPAWDRPALAGVNLLSDFSALIVITDNADVMRNWVEQVQPALGETPLFVVLSAQAGPLIQPYLTSNQIQGGLSGVSGGAMYSQILGKPGFTDLYLNAFQIGAILAVVAILGGGIVQLIGSLAASPAREEKEENGR